MSPTAASTASAVRLAPYSELLADAFVGDPQELLITSFDGALSRADLADRVGALGDELRFLGVGPERLVALRFEPGIEAIVAILGVLSTGAAYLPLDPRHGDTRQAQILATTLPDVLINPGEIITLRSDHLQEPTPAISLDNLAYVISTSGSTGTPKAPMLEQRGFAIHTRAMIELLGLGPGSTMLQTAPPSFDIAVWQNTTPVVAGARTHVASPDERLNPRAFWNVVIDQQITMAQTVPSMLRLLLDAAPPASELALTGIISTGEALDPALANRWFDTYPELPLFNLYGPAECTDDVVTHTLTGPVDPHQPVPIGTAFAGAHLRLIGDDGNEAAAGEVAELQVCGDIVGRGYRNDAERTAESFGLVDVDGVATRTYNTGDLVFEDDQGLLRYVGRRDFQVKIRGNRVELGEIENLLNQHDSIKASVVVKFADDTDRLAAHLQCDDRAIDRAELRAMITAALPSYMCPSAFVCHDALPINANGKIDRSKLPEPTADDFVASSVTADRAPSGPVEIALAGSWATLLHMDTVPVTADFYDLGGTSLLAVMCIDDLQREHGIELTPSTLITAGSIENIAALITAESSTEVGSSVANAHETGLVQLQDHPGSAPLFLYPGEAVSALGMVELARGLAPDRSVWVFEPSRPLDHEPGPSMAELARRCRVAIDSVYPTGPVHLAGFCMGGDVSWEIADQLTAAGRPAASVVLLQTERDGAYPTYPESVSKSQIASTNLRLRVRFERATLDALTKAQASSHARHLIVGKVISKLTMPAEKWLDRSGIRQRLGLPQSLRLKQELWAEVDRASYDGWQPGPITTPVTVISATEQYPLAVPDPLLGWSGISAGPIDARAVDGFHWSFLHHPSVVGLAETLSEVLRTHDQSLEATT